MQRRDRANLAPAGVEGKPAPARLQDTVLDVEQRLRAIWEESRANYPKDELKDGCAALYQSE